MFGPDFIYERIEASDTQVYQPFHPARQGEWIAWGGMAVVVVLGAVRKAFLGAPGTWVWVFAVLLLLSASLISYGNWIAIQTKIETTFQGVRYSSPVRHVYLFWPQLKKLHFESHEIFWRVHVGGAAGSFHFDTPGLLGARTEKPARIGIEKGEQLAALIWQRGRFEKPVFDQDQWVCSKIKVPEA